MRINNIYEYSTLKIEEFLLFHDKFYENFMEFNHPNQIYLDEMYCNLDKVITLIENSITIYVCSNNFIVKKL